MIKPNKGYLNPPKFVFNRKFSKENLDSLMSELQSINILNLLDKNLNNDPNSNYDILHNILTTTINKHIPLNKVKFNKYRHKKTNWITYGILRSIRFRNNLYRKMIQTQNSTDYAKKKHNLSVYNKILKYTI